jgi:hypothetical protein
VTLKLSPDRTDRVSAAIRAVASAAHEATLPNDLDSARRALGLVWWAIHDAQAAINEAERETRDEALNAVRDHHAELLASLSTGEAA